MPYNTGECISYLVCIILHVHKCNCINITAMQNGDNMCVGGGLGGCCNSILVTETPKARISVIPTNMQGLHRAAYQYYVYACLDDITTDCAAIRTDSSYKRC